MKKNIYLSVPQTESLGTFPFLKVSLLGLLLLMAVSTFAQSQNEKVKKETGAAPTIKGIVLSEEDSTVLEGANIILKGTGVGTIADKQGRFVFPQQLKEGDILLFSFVGTQTQEYVVPAQAEADVVIKMKMGFDLTGDLVGNQVYTKPLSTYNWWAKIKRMF